ncbi:MAG: hypothetical protein ACTHM7_18545 [Ginsengibacter sp.]
MATFQEQIDQIQKLRITQSQEDQKAYSTKLSIQKKMAGASQAEIQQALKTAELPYKSSGKTLNDAIRNLHALDFKLLVKELNGNIPLILFPVRIETRFVSPPATQSDELWIRIFPDDIHTDSHEKDLTAEEISAGEAYWKRAAELAKQDNVATREDNLKNAWLQLRDIITNAQRALWVALSTKPVNWENTTVVPPESLTFPQYENIKEYAWTKAPRAQALPDKFIASIYRNNKVVYEQAGNVIPDTVFLGPDPLAADPAIQKDDSGITLNEDIDWLQNFDKAIENGMGMKIKLQPQMFSSGKTIEKITILGISLSTTPDMGKTLLEQLFESHHYSSNGLSFLPRGTATNNTEQDGSGYTKNEGHLARGYYSGEKLVKNPGSDLDFFTQIIGVDFANIHELNHSDMKEHSNALNMNTALYAATLSDFFNEYMKPAVKEMDAINIRSFFTSYVSSRGPLPAIRIGDQPYGFLLSSDIQSWAEPGSKFYSGFSDVLGRLQLVWDGIVNSKKLCVGKGGDTETLLQILGLQPGSVAFRQRLGNLPDYSYSLSNINIDQFKKQVLSLNQVIVNFLQNLGYKLSAENYYPLISDLIFYDRTVAVSGKKLVLPDTESSDTEFLPPLPTSKLNYIEWMAKKATLSALQNVNFDGDIPPRTLLCLLLRHALLTELAQSGTKYYSDNKIDIQYTAFQKSLFNFDKNVGDLTTYELLSGPAQKVDSVKFSGVSGNIADYLLDSRIKIPYNQNVTSMRNAMSQIAGLSTAELEKNLLDFIDLCSYRLDAWQMGLFTRRALANRKSTPSGIYIGAYGWVENVQPETKIAVAIDTLSDKIKPANNIAPVKLKENAGFSHVPSLNHATAMGLLLAGYKNHASKSDPDAFAINLSSERTRKALDILAGINNGQSIEVLLGYEFERAMHDFTSSGQGNLNQYIYDFRNKYAVDNISIPQQGAPQAQETINTYPVVNGLKIVKAPVSEINTIVTDPNLADDVLNIKNKLADLLDACNDVLLAESAYQLTQGNQDRTSAVLNAALLADTPPEIQVTDTPRSSLLTYTHRISLHFNTGAAVTHVNVWPQAASARSAFEPGMNQWLAEIIGNAQNIVCSVAALDKDGNEANPAIVSLSDLGLQPIDLIYILPKDLTGGATELESRIAYQYRKVNHTDKNASVKISFDPAAPGQNKMSLARVYPLLRNLKELVTNSRPATAKDFASKQKTVSSGADDSGINYTELQTRIQHAVTGLTDAFNSFNGIVPNTTLPKGDLNPENLGKFFEVLNQKPGEKKRLDALELNEAAIAAIIDFQIMATGYGVQLAYPENQTLITTINQRDLLEKTFNIWKILDTKIKSGNKKLSDATADTNYITKRNAFIDAAKIVMGDDFVPVPQFTYSNPEIISQSLGDEKQLLSHVETVSAIPAEANKELWIQSVSRVRERVATLESTRIMAESVSENEINFQMAQVPYRPNDSWLGFEFPDQYNGAPFNILDDTIALTLLGDAAANTSSAQSALVIDDWTEKIPMNEEVTGIAFHYNQASAAAPQSVIVAIEPTGTGKWDWDVLQGIIYDTLRRAKSRAVEPDHLMENPALGVLLPMTIASFDVNEANVSLDYLLLSDKFLTVAKTQNLQLYKKWN